MYAMVGQQVFHSPFILGDEGGVDLLCGRSLRGDTGGGWRITHLITIIIIQSTQLPSNTKEGRKLTIKGGGGTSLSYQSLYT